MILRGDASILPSARLLQPGNMKLVLGSILEQHGELTARDENHTGDFFVGLLNLLDKVYVHWVHAVLRSKGQVNMGQHFFRAHGSQAALENAARWRWEHDVRCRR